MMEGLKKTIVKGSFIRFVRLILPLREVSDQNKSEAKTYSLNINVFFVLRS